MVEYESSLAKGRLANYMPRRKWWGVYLALEAHLQTHILIVLFTYHNDWYTKTIITVNDMTIPQMVKKSIVFPERPYMSTTRCYRIRRICTVSVSDIMLLAN